MKKVLNLLLVVAFTTSIIPILAQNISTSSAKPEGYMNIQHNPSGERDWMGCLDCALPEGEADLTGEDVTNGGCNSNPPVYIDINIGDVYCGRGNGYYYLDQDYRDTDWYRLVLTESKTIYWSGIANFYIQLIIAGGECPNPSVINYALPDPGVQGTCSATIGPGTFYVFVSPQNFGDYPGNTGDYMVYLSDAPPQDPWCAPVPLSNWALAIGIVLILAFTVIRFRKL